MMKQDKLPNFLVIGVPKAGTTSLRRYLMGNKQIYFPSIKEPHFFVSQQVKGKIPLCINSWADYMNVFSSAGNSLFIGEASVFYFYYSEYAIQNIKQRLGEDVYIVLMLRNPVERAFSAYRYALALNKDENMPFDQAMDAEQDRILENKVSPMLFYVQCGLYAERLERWKAAFKNFKVVLFDDLVINPGAVTGDIFRFLGLNSETPVDFSRKYNTGFGGEWKNPYMGKLVKILVSRSLRNFSHKFCPSGYQFIKNKFLSTAMRGASLGTYERCRLLDEFSCDIEETASIIDRDLSSWI